MLCLRPLRLAAGGISAYRVELSEPLCQVVQLRGIYKRTEFVVGEQRANPGELHLKRLYIVLYEVLEAVREIWGNPNSREISAALPILAGSELTGGKN